MAYTIETGSRSLDKETIQSIVTQTAQRSYIFMQSLGKESSNSRTHVWFRKDPTILTGSEKNPIEGVPDGADFPTAKIKLERIETRIVNFKLEDNMPMEVERGSEVNVAAETVIGLTEGVVNAVDSYIWGELSQDLATTDSSVEIQSYLVGGGGVNITKYWDVSSGNIADDLAEAERMIEVNANADTTGLEVHVNPRDYRSIKQWVVSKGTQFQAFAEDVVKNGRVGRLNGMMIVRNRTVASSFALVIKPVTSATWFEFLPLQSTRVEDPLKNTTFRVAQEGAVGRKEPKQIVLIKGTLSTP